MPGACPSSKLSTSHIFFIVRTDYIIALIISKYRANNYDG